MVFLIWWWVLVLVFLCVIDCLGYIYVCMLLHYVVGLFVWVVGV